MPHVGEESTNAPGVGRTFGDCESRIAGKNFVGDVAKSETVRFTKTTCTWLHATFFRHGVIFCVCVLFGSLFLNSMHAFQMECSTKCAMLMRCSVAALTSTPCRSVGASDSPESIWNPSCTQQFLGREPDPPKSGSSSSSALARMLDPPQGGSRSPAAIQLVLPSRVTAAIAERCRPPQRGRT